MEELISYMRDYDDTAAPGEKPRFYGFDMQRYRYSFSFLLETCKELGVDTWNLEKLVDGEEWSGEYDALDRVETITYVKNELESKENAT